MSACSDKTEDSPDTTQETDTDTDTDIDTAVTLSADMPHDVSIADTSDPMQAEFDLFSWQSFVALSWPAAGGTIGDGGDAPTVWEGWSSTADLLNLSEPSFGDVYVPSACDGVYKEGMLVIAQAAKKSGAFQDEILEASGEPLVDQNGAFTRYEIRINEEMFSTITTNGWDTAAGQKGQTFNFPCGDSDGVGAVEAKAAWKILSLEESASGRFHARSAALYVPASQAVADKESCEAVDIGLVGLHIVHKTTQQPMWVWSSFEHVDNVPDCQGQDAPGYSCPTADDGETYSYFATDCPDEDPGCAACEQPPAHNNGESYAVDVPAQRVMACRPSSLLPSAVDLNSRYQQALADVDSSSVWQNYMLVNTQWNTDIATDGGCSDVADSYNKANNAPQDSDGNPLPVGNIAMETFDWSENTGTGADWVSPSCIDCHSFATSAADSSVKTDFIFFLGIEVGEE
jgi:hypothetical protein